MKLCRDSESRLDRAAALELAAWQPHCHIGRRRQRTAESGLNRQIHTIHLFEHVLQFVRNQLEGPRIERNIDPSYHAAIGTDTDPGPGRLGLG